MLVIDDIWSLFDWLWILEILGFRCCDFYLNYGEDMIRFEEVQLINMYE